MPISAATSNRIKNLGLFGTLLVVMIHTWHSPVSNPIGWALVDLLHPSLTGVAVPFFFSVSGYLLAGHVGTPGWYATEGRKRVRSLLVPLLLWMLTWMVGRLLIAIWVGDSFSPSALWLEDVTCKGGYPRPLLFDITGGWLSALGLNPFAFPAMIQFWYLRALFVLVLLSPLCVRLARWWGLVALFVLYAAVCPFVSGEYGALDIFFRSTLSLEGLFYFTVGMYLRRHPIALPRWGVMAMAVVAVGTVAAGSWCRYHGMTAGGNWLRWASLPLVLGTLWCVTPAVNLPGWLTACAFPIYLLHIIVIRLLEFVPLPFDRLGPVGSWGVRVGVVFVFSAGVAMVMRWVSPKVASVYFGGR